MEEVVLLFYRMSVAKQSEEDIHESVPFHSPLMKGLMERHKIVIVYDTTILDNNNNMMLTVLFSFFSFGKICKMYVEFKDDASIQIKA